MNPDYLERFDNYRKLEAKQLRKLSHKQLMLYPFTQEVKAEIARRDSIKFRNGRNFNKKYFG